MKKLNLGCGNNYKKDYINIDIIKDYKADLYFDLNKIPYPLPKNYADKVLGENILEHLDNPINVLKELIRISKNNAKIILEVPHAYTYTNISDLQHKNNFTEHTFTKNHLVEYGLKELKLVNVKLLFYYSWKKLIPLPLKKLFNGFFDSIRFEFTVKK